MKERILHGDGFTHLHERKESMIRGADGCMAGIMRFLDWNDYPVVYLIELIFG